MDKESKDIKLIKRLFIAILLLICFSVAAFVFWLSVSPRVIENNNVQYVVSSKEPKSAYEVAQLNGFKGNELEWLASLKGKDGKSELTVKHEKSVVHETIIKEIPAEKAKDGKSAYQIWLDQGNHGSQSDFLNSLIPIVNVPDRKFRFNELNNRLETKLENQRFWSPIESCGISQPCN